MSDNNPLLKTLVIGILFSFVLAAIAAIVIRQAQFSRADLPVLGRVPNFEFTERSGIPFGKEEMKGSICVVDFIFTNCPSACPIMSSHISELYKLYAHSDKIRFVSISVDPARDSLRVLQEYAKSHGVTDNRWLFLRAPIEQVITLSEKGVMLPAENLPMGHSTKLVLVDPNGNIRGYYDGLNDASIAHLKEAIKALAKRMS